MPDYYVPWSEREGLSEVRTQIQGSGMDERLRVDLWNAFCIAVVRSAARADVLRGIWTAVLSRPIDEYNERHGVEAAKIAVLRGDWRLACNVVEFAGEGLFEPDAGAYFELTNRAFDRGKFAWRFSGRKLIRRMGEAEIKAIEVALQDSEPLLEVRKQLETALAEFSSRGNANYGHAAKEAISAVETLCRKIVGKPSVTLGEALKEIRRSGKPQVHAALIDSFSSLYGYASDKGLVRHGAKPDDPTDVTLEEAQLVLVTCSAIVSFLIARADREGMLE